MREKTTTAFLIHGYLGAGKTTLARRLEVEEAAIRFTHDEWMRLLYAPREAGPCWPTGDDLPEAQFSEYAERVSGVMEAVWTRCVALKMNVVLDFGFWTRSERDRVRALVASLGSNSVLYRLSCPDEVAWSRIEKRNKRLGADLYIEPNTFKVLKARFEPLDPDEVRVEVEA
jgi:predicted kinase